MARNLGINIKIGADLKQFSTDMQNVQRQMKRQARKMKQTGRAMTRSLTLPMALIGGASVKLAADFEQSMAKVRAVSGATGDEFKKLNDNALELGRTTRFTAGEVAELQLNLSKLGFKPKEITDSTEAILNLALASGEDLAQSATVAAGTMRGFGIATAESGRVADVMAKSFSSSGLDLEKFSVSMSKIAPVAKAAGFSFEQTTAMMSALADANVEASTIGTSLRQIFIELASKGISYSDAMEQIRNSTSKTVTATDLFDQRAAAAAIILSESEAKVNSLNHSYLNAGGSAADMAKIMDDTLQGAFKRLQSALEGAAISMGDILKPAIQGLTDFVASLATKFTNLDPVTKKIIAVMGVLAAAIGPVTIALGFMLPALTAVKVAIVGVEASMLSLFVNPFTIGVAAIAGLVIGIRELDKYLIENSQTLKKTRGVIDELTKANGNLEEQIGKVNQIVETGVEIDNAARESMIKKTRETINETIAKIENARATRRQLIEEKKLQLQRALAATRGVGQQGEFIGAEMSGIKAIEKSIDELNSSLIDSDRLLMKTYHDLENLKEFEGVDIKKSIFGDTQPGTFNEELKGTKREFEDLSESFKDISSDFDPSTFENNVLRMAQIHKKAAEKMKETNAQIKQSFDKVRIDLKPLIMDIAADLGDFIERMGMAAGGVDDVFQNFGEKALVFFADFLGKFGKLLFSGGIAAQVAKTSLFANPPLAIAAGAALIGIAGLIKGMSEQDPLTGLSQNPTYTPPASSGGTFSYANTNNVLTLETVVYGRDIVLSSNRQHGTISRTRRK